MNISESDRVQLMLHSLEGLSVGDAMGEQFFDWPAEASRRVDERLVPAGPWQYTDDTIMAVSIVELLREHGRINQDRLAAAFAQRYAEKPDRGYGPGAHRILGAIAHGADWHIESHAAFDGAGSAGNGGAMRAGPLGAYFCNDIDRLISQAALSAEVTHAHPDGQVGAIAVALAAAWAVRRVLGNAGPGSEPYEESVFDFVRRHIPDGKVRSGITRAASLPAEANVRDAAALLGSGVRTTAADTVPFCLWIVNRHPDNFESAIWATLAGLGDRDTTCAIVGSIVALCDTTRGIPREWRERREALPLQKPTA